MPEYVSDLIPNPENPRKVSAKKLATLKRSLEEFGDLSGIVFNRTTGRLVGGHQRREILDKRAKIWRKEKEITACGTVADGYIELSDGNKLTYREVAWDETKEKAANIAANKGVGEWDLPKLGEWLADLDKEGFDLDLTLFDEDERKELLAGQDAAKGTEGLTDADEVPEQVETRAKLGDLWLLGEHRLLCGDSTDAAQVNRLMGGAKAELCFTSPPYSDQREYNGGKELSTEHLAKFISASSPHINLFAVNLGLSRKDNEIQQYWDDYIKEAKKCGLKLLSWNVWNKGVQGSVGQLTAMFPIAHEWIFVFGKERKKLNKTITNESAHRGKKTSGDRQKDGSIRKKEFERANTRILGTVVNMSGEMSHNQGFDHPAVFPVKFCQIYIDTCTNIGENIYEPFCGSGSTLIACEKTGRKCFGMEIDPHYCDVIVERWEKFTGKKAILDGGIIFDPSSGRVLDPAIGRAILTAGI